jgi:hypothetical protein
MVDRKQGYLGELGSVGKKSRHRNLLIPEPLLATLIGLSHRASFSRPDDFVLAMMGNFARGRTSTQAGKINKLLNQLPLREQGQAVILYQHLVI